MTNILEQLPSGPNLDIIGFLVDDSKAIGALKVASRSMYNTIAKFERLPKTPFTLGYLLSSTDTGIAFPTLRRISGAFDLPKCSVKTMLVLRRNIIAKQSTTPVMPNHTYDQAELNRRTEYLLSLALNFKAEIDKEERKEILSAIICELQNIDSIGKRGQLALIANLDSFFNLFSKIGIGNSKTEQRLSWNLVRILDHLHAELQIDVNFDVEDNHITPLDNFENRASVINSEFLLDYARSNDESRRDSSELFVEVGALKMRIESLLKGGTEAKHKSLANIESIINIISDLYRENPELKKQLSLKIEGAPDEATKVILTDLLASIKKGSELLGSSGGRAK